MPTRKRPRSQPFVPVPPSPKEEENPSAPPVEQTQANQQAEDRNERMRELRARMRQSGSENRKEVIAEHKRLKVNPRLLAKEERKKAEAAQGLAETEMIEAGEDLERRKAWDYTVEDNERWTEKLEQKEQNRHDALFSDYSKAAEVQYDRHMRNLKPHLEEYEKQKREKRLNRSLIRTSVSGEVGYVQQESDDADDDDGTIDLGFVDNKPSKAAIDRLVKDLRKQEENRGKSTRRREKDGGEVSYINQQNKVFNQKVSRFYDKYTTEIKDALERGTGI